MPEIIEQQNLPDIVKSHYLDYALSVIIDRALPEFKDFLKPVNRRILYGMYNMGLYHNAAFKKCGRAVGEIMGKFHCHGKVK